MKPMNHLVIASFCVLAAWMPLADAQERTRHETRSGVLEFEANGYPTDETVRHIQEEIDYQRAVQAYIHFVPAVGMMQWRNGHFGALGGKAGDLIVYRTTEQKLPIITANDTTTYVITFAELSDTGGLLMYEVPPGPTGGGINDLWQRTVTDTGMVGPERGKGGKFLIVLEGTDVPENHGADFVITSKTSTIIVGTRILTPDPKEGQRILNAHKIHGLGKESTTRVFEAPNNNWEGHQPRGLEYWKVVHQAIQLNPLEERDMAVMQGLKNLGIEKGKPFARPPRRRRSWRKRLSSAKPGRWATASPSPIPSSTGQTTQGPSGSSSCSCRARSTRWPRATWRSSANRVHVRGNHGHRGQYDEPCRRGHPVPRGLQGRRRPVAGRRQDPRAGRAPRCADAELLVRGAL